MKIIVVIPVGNIKMDSDVYCEALEKLGHTIVRVKYDKGEFKFSSNTDNSDLIWCPYEQEIPIGLDIKKELNIPIVGHFEWVPPWRVGADSPFNWGYLPDNCPTKEQMINFNKRYSYWIDNYEQCDLRTAPTSYCYNTLSFVKKNETVEEVYQKPYIVDDEYLSKFKGDYKKKNQILTIGRLVPHKRIHHIILALSKLKTRPLLKIVGYGELKSYLQSFADSLKVKIEFVGEGQEGDKAKHIQESLFLVTPFASLPCGEAALFKIPTIMYDSEPMTQKHSDMGKYVKTNDADELSKAIKFWLDNPEEVTKEGNKSYENFINGRSGLCTSRVAADRMIDIFKVVLK